MGNYTVTALPSDGDTMDAADVTTDLNGLISEFNGSIDNTNIKASAAIDFSKLASAASTSHSATITGFSGTPTQAIKYIKIGRLVTIEGSITGTSNATGFTFTLPFAAEAAIRHPVSIVDNTSWVSPAILTTAASSTTVTLGLNAAGTGAFTASGTKGAEFRFTYIATS